MKVPLHDILELYERIIKQINVADYSVILFSALDMDSLCTLKILSKFLKNQNILFKVHPVSSYTELETKIEDCKVYEKLRMFFFINCGGLIDLTTKWFSKQAEVILLDVNKPIHHANIEAENIKIVDDYFSELEKAPTVQEVEMYENMDQLMEEDKNNQQSQDQFDDAIARRRRRTRQSQQTTLRMQKLRKIKTQITQKVQIYYASQFFGLPSSYIAYKMIKQLNKLNNSYLWYAIVGATSMLLEQKLQKQQYDTIFSQYCTDMLKFNTQSGNQKHSIKKKLDFHFPLLRHWSLYDSIMNSAYMITNLRLWQTFGVKKLLELLNMIGLSVEESKQLYKYMSKASIAKLESKIFEYASMDKYKLLEVAFDSFTKQVDYAFEMTASDYYYALSAVLERPTKKVNMEEIYQHRVTCFLEAYEIIDSNQQKLLLAIEQSKKLLVIITKQALNIIQRSHILNTKTFAFVNIIDDTQDRKVLQNPQTLIRLAYFLLLINIEKKKAKNKPFIACLQNNLTQTTQMVGINNEIKNNFSSRFNAVITKLEIEVRMDSFTSTIMTVPKESMPKIIRELNENQ